VQVTEGCEAAKALETRLHKEVMRAGIPLDSYYDSKRFRQLRRQADAEARLEQEWD
jgi:hypothetical protein